MCRYLCACVRMRACMRAYVCVRMRACVRAYMCVCLSVMLEVETVYAALSMGGGRSLSDSETQP